MTDTLSDKTDTLIRFDNDVCAKVCSLLFRGFESTGEFKAT